MTEWPSVEDALAAVAAWESVHGYDANEIDVRLRFARPLPEGLDIEAARVGASLWGNLEQARKQARLRGEQP
jgi:hypothetical protein